MQIDVIAPKGHCRYWVGFNPITIAWTAIGFLICTYAIPTEWRRCCSQVLVTC
jgi:hypothetical protein